MIALPAAGCGAATCPELTRLTLPSVGNPPSEYSLGDGRLVGAGPGAHLFALGL